MILNPWEVTPKPKIYKYGGDSFTNKIKDEKPMSKI